MPLPFRAAFGFRREKVLVSVSGVTRHTPSLLPALLCLCLFLTCSLCFPSCTPSLSLPCMPLLAGGFVCHRENPAAQMCCLACSLLRSPGAATPPGPPALMKSCRGFIWQLLIRCGGLSCPQTSLPPPSYHPSHPECSVETREAARRGNPSWIWPRALRLTLAPKWKNVRSTTRAP